LIQSNQKSSQQKCFFAHKASTLQIRQNHGLLNLASTLFAHSLASARFANAPATALPIMFCRLSSEAYLLTWKKDGKYKCVIARNEAISLGQILGPVILSLSKDRAQRLPTMLRQAQHDTPAVIVTHITSCLNEVIWDFLIISMHILFSPVFYAHANKILS
jgi:hypothetical protein